MTSEEKFNSPDRIRLGEFPEVIYRKFGKVEQAAKYSQAIKNCPSCATSLVLLVEKLAGSTNGEQSEMLNPQFASDPTSGWFCNNCGVHIIPGEESKMSAVVERILTSMRNEQFDPANLTPQALMGDSAASPARKLLDDDYNNWESQLQSEFSDFLGVIRDHFSDKERQLRKYQVDLCQRERQLKNSEESFRERMDKFKSSEHELHDRIERLNEYKKTMLKQVSAQMKTLEFRCRAGNGYRKQGTQTFEAWCQTDIAGVHGNLTRTRGDGPEAASNGPEPPPPYSSNHDLAQRDRVGGSQVPLLPLSVESGYTSRGSSLSPDSARNIWDRYGQTEDPRPVHLPKELGYRSYSPSRSVAVDEVQIRYGAQSPPERDAPLVTSTPAKSADPGDQRPTARETQRVNSPHRDARNFSPSSGRYQSFPSREREMSPNRNDPGVHPDIPVPDKRGWVQPERSNSPCSLNLNEPPPVVPSPIRPERGLSPRGRKDLTIDLSPPRGDPCGLTAQTNSNGIEVLLQYNQVDANKTGPSPQRQSGIPVQRSGPRRSSNPSPWANNPEKGTSPDPGPRETSEVPGDVIASHEVQVEVEKDEPIPEKPRLHAVRSWDIINNGLEPIASVELDGIDILGPSTATPGLVPPSSGNLVPQEEPPVNEDLTKPIEDPRFFQFAPQKSSGQPSPASDHSNLSIRKGTNGVLRKPMAINKSRMRLQEHLVSSASDADSRSSASNYVYHVNGAEDERGRPMSRMVKSGSNIGSYDAKQYTAHHRSTSAGRVLDEGSRRGKVDEGFYDVRGASKALNFGNADDNRTEDQPPPGRQLRQPRQLPVRPAITNIAKPVKQRPPPDEGSDGHYVDMNGSSGQRIETQNRQKPEKPTSAKPTKSSSPNRFTSKLSMLVRKGDSKNNPRESSDPKSKSNGYIGKIKLDDKSTWAIKKRRDESKKQKETGEESQPPPIPNGHVQVDDSNETPKKSKPFRRQPLPFSLGAGRRSLNSGVSGRGRSPSPNPMRADHTIISNTDSIEGSVVRQSSGRSSGQPPVTGPFTDYVRDDKNMNTLDDNANDTNLQNENTNQRYGSNISKSHTGPKRQITPPREYHSRIPRSGSPNRSISKLSNYREYANHISPQQNGTNTYDSEV